ncbi:MAG: hypothetical protein ACFUZC_01840 [Chthoniobacteraceae bacterium]
MIGVAVFSLGMLALARCAGGCLGAEAARAWDERARVALANRAAEIEAGAAKIDTDATEKLTGPFEGITLRQKRKPLPIKDEAGKDLAGIFQIQLEAVWQEWSGTQSKTLTFYVYQQT